jgi:TP901 family phage tail tape measure protein
MVHAMETALKRLDSTAKSAGRSLKTVAGPKAQQNMEKLEKSVKKTGDSFKRISGGLRSFSANWNRYVTLPIAGAAVASLKFARDFNAGLANVATLIPGQTKRVQELRGSILKMSADSGKSLDDLTSATYETVSAFGDSEETVKRLDAATKASIAGRSTTIDAVKLLSAVTKGYGDTSAEALRKASDLSFMTVKMGQTTFPELASSMGKVIPLAAQMETRQEELFGVFATLTGVTGTASEVTTQLASVYRAFLNPSEALTKVAKKHGAANAAALLKTKGLAETIKILGQEAKGSEPKMLKFLRRGEALNAVLPLTGKSADTFAEKLKKINEFSGATEEAFKEQTEGINKTGHEYEQAKRRMIALSVAIGTRLLPVVNKLLDRLEPWFEKLEDIDDATIDQAIAIGKWAIAIGAATKALSLLTGVLSPMSGMFGGAAKSAGIFSQSLTGAMGSASGLAGKLGVLARSIGAVGAAAGIGVGIGQMLNETIFDPMARREGALDERSQTSITESRIALKKKRATTAGGLESDIAKRDKQLESLRRTELERTSKGLSPETIAGEVTSFFTGEESPRERRERELQQLTANRRALAQRHVTVQGSSVTVNTTGGDPKRISQAVKKELDRNNRRQARELDRIVKGGGPTEQ